MGSCIWWGTTLIIWPTVYPGKIRTPFNTNFPIQIERILYGEILDPTFNAYSVLRLNLELFKFSLEIELFKDILMLKFQKI